MQSKWNVNLLDCLPGMVSRQIGPSLRLLLCETKPNKARRPKMDLAFQDARPRNGQRACTAQAGAYSG